MRQFLMKKPASEMGRTFPALGPVAVILGFSMLGANRAEAQYGYGGVYGCGCGYGAGMGMTLEDQQLLKTQIYALDATQVQLNEAQALRDYWAAELLSEQTLSVALSNCRLADGQNSLAVDKPPARRAVTHRRHAVRPAHATRRIPAAVADVPNVAIRDKRDPRLRRP
jgi:hypothetical protein